MLILITLKNLKRHNFDHIFCNPPFYEEGEIILPKDKNKRNAYYGEKDFIADWIKLSLTFVKSKGSITFINHIKNLLISYQFLQNQWVM